VDILGSMLVWVHAWALDVSLRARSHGGFVSRVGSPLL
jgi:hypothetical protein